MRERYVASARHTIQVDFHPYMRLLEAERRRGSSNGSAGRRRLRGLGLPTPSR